MRDGFSSFAMANICFLRSHAARRRARAFVHGAPIDPRDRATLCALHRNRTKRSGLGQVVFALPHLTAVEHGGWLGTRNPRARINSCFARLSTIWPGKSTRFTTVRRPATCPDKMFAITL